MYVCTCRSIDIEVDQFKAKLGYTEDTRVVNSLYAGISYDASCMNCELLVLFCFGS